MLSQTWNEIFNVQNSDDNSNIDHIVFFYNYSSNWLKQNYKLHTNNLHLE